MSHLFTNSTCKSLRFVDSLWPIKKRRKIGRKPAKPVGWLKLFIKSFVFEPTMAFRKERPNHEIYLTALSVAYWRDSIRYSRLWQHFVAVFGCRGEFKVLCQHGMALLHGIGTRLFFQWDVAAVFLRQGKEKKDVDNIGIDFIVLLLFSLGFSRVFILFSCRSRFCFF